MEALITWLSALGFYDWNPWTFLTIVLMACVTVITRSFFFISDDPWNLPSWAQRGMQYAPIAALSAVVLPELLMTKGLFIHTWADARSYGAVAGAARQRAGSAWNDCGGHVGLHSAPCRSSVVTRLPAWPALFVLLKQTSLA